MSNFHDFDAEGPGVGPRDNSGGGHKTAGSPVTIDIQGLINAQREANQHAFEQSLIDQIGPLGSVNFVRGDDGRFDQITSLHPELYTSLLQNLFQNTHNQAFVSALIGDANHHVLSRGPDFDSLPGLPSLEGTQFARDRVEQDLVDRFNRNLNPIFEKQEEDLIQRLLQSGNARGTPKFNSELERLREQQADSRLDAISNAVQAGGAEQNRLFGLQASSRELALQNEINKRTVPISIAGALLGLNSPIQGFSGGSPNVGQPASTNILGAGLQAASLAQQADLAAQAQALQQQQFQASLDFQQQELNQQNQQFNNQLDANKPALGGFGGILSGIGAGVGAGIFGSLF